MTEDMTQDMSQDASGFADLELRPELVRALARLGYEEPTPIQRLAIPPLLAGRDLLGQAATGTGKTAAFALPVLQRIPWPRKEAEPLALVLVPTRELAVQVSEAMHRYGHDLGARVVPVYGGQPIGRQLRVAQPRCRRGGGHAGARARPHRPGHARLAEPHDGRPRRGRRDARHGLRRGHRVDPPGHPGGPADPAVLGHHAARGSTAWSAATCVTPPGSSSGARSPRRTTSPWCARARTWCRAATSRPRSAGCSTSRHPRRRSCSAAPVSRSTS